MTVIDLGKYSNNAAFSSMESVVEDALEAVREGGDWESYDKLVVLALRNKNEDYSVSWKQAGLSNSELLALFEVAKTMALEELGYLSKA